MGSVFIPCEEDIKKWVKEAVTECLEQMILKKAQPAEGDELLLSRREIAKMLGISLVTLTDWMKKEFPYHKVNGRVYFLRSEVLEFVKNRRRK